MLKVALPRPSIDAVSRGEERLPSWRPFDDEPDDAAFKALTATEAEAFRRRHPTLSPWRVIAAQIVLGFLAVGVAGLAAGPVAAVSALYGAAVVVVPGALMARGATSRISSLSPVISALSMLGWAIVKLTASVALLVLASRIVPGVIWPVLLGTMVLCMQSYWFALLWRGRAA